MAMILFLFFAIIVFAFKVLRGGLLHYQHMSPAIRGTNTLRSNFT